MCAAAAKHPIENFCMKRGRHEASNPTPKRRLCSSENEPRIQHTMTLHKEETRKDDDEASILILIFWNEIPFVFRATNLFRCVGLLVKLWDGIGQGVYGMTRDFEKNGDGGEGTKGCGGMRRVEE